MTGFNAQPVPKERLQEAMNIQDEAERVAYLQRLGIRNMIAPQRARYLKVKATGVVLPWNEIMAEQVDLVECCDEFGNTDPAAWQNQEPQGVLDVQAQNVLIMKQHERNIIERETAAHMSQFAQPLPSTMTQQPQSSGYLNDSVPYAEVQKLLDQMGD